MPRCRALPRRGFRVVAGNRRAAPTALNPSKRKTRRGRPRHADASAVVSISTSRAHFLGHSASGGGHPLCGEVRRPRGRPRRQVLVSAIAADAEDRGQPGRPPLMRCSTVSAPLYRRQPRAVLSRYPPPTGPFASTTPATSRRRSVGYARAPSRARHPTRHRAFSETDQTEGTWAISCRRWSCTATTTRSARDRPRFGSRSSCQERHFDLSRHPHGTSHHPYRRAHQTPGLTPHRGLGHRHQEGRRPPARGGGPAVRAGRAGRATGRWRPPPSSTA